MSKHVATASPRGGPVWIVNAAVTTAPTFAGFALMAALVACPPAVSAQSIADAAPTPAASENARDVLGRVRQSVIQIEGLVGSNTARSFHGTGFAVTSDGLFMTNYHVVSEQVQHPDKYRLRFRTPDGASGAVNVVAVDVENDLAVVRTTAHMAPPLDLVGQPPRKGERAYSVGFPLDVGLTITEGISNGEVEGSFDARIHYSGAINGGMSGGPAFNANGQVIGVNVSGYRFEQLVSFLVPAAHAVRLRDRAKAATADPAALTAEIAAQLRAHSSNLLGAFIGPLVTQNSAGYELPAKIAPFVDCSAIGNPTVAQIAQTTRINCTSKAGVYLKAQQSTGDIRYTHTVVTSDKLGAWRFAARLSNHAHVISTHGLRRDVGPFACDGSVVALKGFAARISICTRSHRKNTGLYDTTVTVASLNGSRQGFTSDLTMIGLEYEPSMKFIQRYLEAMEWKPSLPKP